MPTQDTMNNSTAAGAVPPLRPVTSIYITTEAGIKLVEAKIVGAFGMHLCRLPPTRDHRQSLDPDPHRQWASLARVGSEIEAHVLAERLNAIPADWDFRTPEQMSNWPEAQIAEVSALVEQYGQPFRSRPTAET